MSPRNILYNKGKSYNIRLPGRFDFVAKCGYNIYLPTDLVESYIKIDIIIPTYKVITLFGLLLSIVLTITSLYNQKWILSVGYISGLIFYGLLYKILNNKENSAEKEVERILSELVPYQTPEEPIYETYQTTIGELDYMEWQ